jgi:hypothetical protein
VTAAVEAQQLPTSAPDMTWPPIARNTTNTTAAPMRNTTAAPMPNTTAAPMRNPTAAPMPPSTTPAPTAGPGEIMLFSAMSSAASATAFAALMEHAMGTPDIVVDSFGGASLGGAAHASAAAVSFHFVGGRAAALTAAVSGMPAAQQQSLLGLTDVTVAAVPSITTAAPKSASTTAAPQQPPTATSPHSALTTAAPQGEPTTAAPALLPTTTAPRAPVTTAAPRFPATTAAPHDAAKTAAPQRAGRPPRSASATDDKKKHGQIGAGVAVAGGAVIVAAVVVVVVVVVMRRRARAQSSAFSTTTGLAALAESSYHAEHDASCNESPVGPAALPLRERSSPV